MGTLRRQFPVIGARRYRRYPSRISINDRSAAVTQQDKPVWFITGCSTGFGRELAR